MKVLIILVVALVGLVASDAVEYGGKCDDAKKCAEKKHLTCSKDVCTCERDVKNFGKYVADVKAAATGCKDQCGDDAFKCGKNAECDGKKFCKCKEGFVFDDEYKPADNKASSFVCKEPIGVGKCGEKKDDFELKENKCHCKDAKMKLSYKVDKGTYTCGKNAGALCLPTLLGLIAMVTLVKFL